MATDRPTQSGPVSLRNFTNERHPNRRSELGRLQAASSASQKAANRADDADGPAITGLRPSRPAIACQLCNAGRLPSASIGA